jgi:hypothetical protein
LAAKSRLQKDAEGRQQYGDYDPQQIHSSLPAPSSQPLRIAPTEHIERRPGKVCSLAIEEETRLLEGGEGLVACGSAPWAGVLCEINVGTAVRSEQHARLNRR